MRTFSVMVALFLAGVWPTMARAQGVAPPGNAPANAPVGDPPPRLAVDPSDGSISKNRVPPYPRAPSIRRTPPDGASPGREWTARGDPRVDLRAGFDGGVAPAEPLDILQRGLGRGLRQLARGD